MFAIIPRSRELHRSESRWRNSHVLVYHPLLSHLLGVAPSTFEVVYVQLFLFFLIISISCIASFFSHGNSLGNLHVTATLGPIGIIDHEHYDLHKHYDHHNHHDHHNYKHHKHYGNHNHNHHDHKPTFSSVGSGISGMSIPILFGADHGWPPSSRSWGWCSWDLPTGCLVWQWFSMDSPNVKLNSVSNYTSMQEGNSPEEYRKPM